MTLNEIIIFGAGINLGMLLTVAVVMLGDTADARRDQRTAATHLQNTLKHEATRNWRDVLTEQVKA